MTWHYKHLLAFNDPHTTHWWLARDLPCRLENWVKPKSSLVLNKDLLALLETVTKCDQLPTPHLPWPTGSAAIVWTQVHVWSASFLKDFIPTWRTALFFIFTQRLIVQLSKAWQRNQNCSYIQLQITLRKERQKAAPSSFATGFMSRSELLEPRFSCHMRPTLLFLWRSHGWWEHRGSVAIQTAHPLFSLTRAPQGLCDTPGQHQKGLYAFQTCKSSHLTKDQSPTPFQNRFPSILTFTQLDLLLHKQQAFRKELVLPRETCICLLFIYNGHGRMRYF